MTKKSKDLFIILTTIWIGCFYLLIPNRKTIGENSHKIATPKQRIPEITTLSVQNKNKISSINTSPLSSMKGIKPSGNEKLFPQFIPLNHEEMERFKLVPAQIVKYYDFGKMDAEEINSFRQLLWTMGERGIATIANLLNEMSITHTPNSSTAKEMISYIDFLRYLSQSSKDWPLATETIEKLAKRPVVWNEEGKMVDKAKAGITLECFQILSSIKAKDAEDFILNLEDEKKAPYIYNYIIGRKLANSKEETVILRAKEIFGEELVNNATGKI